MQALVSISRYSYQANDPDVMHSEVSISCACVHMVPAKQNLAHQQRTTSEMRELAALPAQDPAARILSCACMCACMCACVHACDHLCPCMICLKADSGIP
jgi:hypothetical protein